MIGYKLKIICIDNTHRECDLTLNKVYDAEYIPMCKNSTVRQRPDQYGYNPCYKITTDRGIERPIDRDRFIPVCKVRHDKLKELGI